MEATAAKGDAAAFVESLLLALATPDASAEGGVVDLTLGTSGSSSSSQTTASSSLNRVRDLLTSSLRIVTQKLAKQIKDEISVDAKAGGNEQVFLKMEDVQCFEPRGRFNASFTANGLLLEGKNANGFIPWESVSHVSAFPSNATTKKEGEDLLAMRLSPAIKFAGKDMSGVLFSLSKCLGTPVTATRREVSNKGAGAGSGEVVQGTPAVVVPQVIAELWNRPVVSPRKELFQSISTGPGGATRPYLRCHRGVQEGAIYPLSNGVVFVKPLLFLPAEEIASLTAGRGGGSGQTRYVDLKIETADDKVHEFVNIEREELPALQAYVKGYLETRAKEAEARRKEDKKKEGAGGGGADGDDDDSDSEDDEDFDPDASDDDDDSDASGNSDGEVDDDDDDDNSKVSEADAAPVKKKAKAKRKAEAAEKENHEMIGDNEAKEAAGEGAGEGDAAAMDEVEPGAKRVRLEETLEA